MAVRTLKSADDEKVRLVPWRSGLPVTDRAGIFVTHLANLTERYSSRRAPLIWPRPGARVVLTRLAGPYGVCAKAGKRDRVLELPAKRPRPTE